jgi:hypothetical protein
MRQLLISLSALLSTVTACQSVMSDDAMLLKCWGASPAGETGKYQVRLEAIVFGGVEGGIFARTTECPDHRLRLRYDSPLIGARFEEIRNSVATQAKIGTVVRLNANIRIYERTDEHHITVLVTDILSWKTMSDAQTEEFINKFDIG